MRAVWLVTDQNDCVPKGVDRLIGLINDDLQKVLSSSASFGLDFNVLGLLMEVRILMVLLSVTSSSLSFTNSIIYY